jgi:hypothetical protein
MIIVNVKNQRLSGRYASNWGFALSEKVEDGTMMKFVAS